MEEKEMENRMSEIQSEYAQLPQLDRFDLSLESRPDGGVSVSLDHGDNKIRRVIAPKEDLSFIGDTFFYPNTFTPRSKMISTDGLREAYFDKYGYLVVVHDNSTESFKVASHQKEEVSVRLKEHLGDKFNKVKKPKPSVPATYQYKVSFTKDGIDDYFVVEASTLEGTRRLAFEQMAGRGITFKENNIKSSKIN
jgi:hypothetical protein